MNHFIKKPRIIAHRGASAYAPENTLEAFAKAIEMGADGIELDVHLSKDLEIMVSHDASLRRTTGGEAGVIRELTYAELQAYDVGVEFYGEHRGSRMPTLKQVYELIAPTNLFVNVEVKSLNPAAPAALIELEKSCGMEGRVLYSSFHHTVLMKLKRLNPNAVIAPLYRDLVDAWDYVSHIGATVAHPSLKQLAEYPDMMEQFHKKGIEVNFWTANSEEEIQMLIDAGCDGIITNYPDVVLALREKGCES